MFTIVKKPIYIDNKKHDKFKLIKWVDAGRYMSNNKKNTSIFPIGHVSSCKA